MYECEAKNCDRVESYRTEMIKSQGTYESSSAEHKMIGDAIQEMGVKGDGGVNIVGGIPSSGGLAQNDHAGTITVDFGQVDTLAKNIGVSGAREANANLAIGAGVIGHEFSHEKTGPSSTGAENRASEDRAYRTQEAIMRPTGVKYDVNRGSTPAERERLIQQGVDRSNANFCRRVKC